MIKMYACFIFSLPGLLIASIYKIMSFPIIVGNASIPSPFGRDAFVYLVIGFEVGLFLICIKSLSSYYYPNINNERACAVFWVIIGIFLGVIGIIIKNNMIMITALGGLTFVGYDAGKYYEIKKRLSSSFN